MRPRITRRKLIACIPALCCAGTSITATPAIFARTRGDQESKLHPEFPAQNPALVREIVGASHRDLARVKELLEVSPALAKAAWDWGFGDWETAIGAASHVGNREIAQALIEHGARPDLFTFAMFGQLDVVKAYISANPGVQRIPGPHGLTLLHHARAGGDGSKSVADYLESLGDADPRPADVPLEDSEKARYVGVYASSAPNVIRLSVERDRRGNLAIARAGEGTARILTHLGNHEFHPAGAAAVRIRFTLADSRAESLTITDGRPVLTARREG
jgi:hypothetical protein